MKLEAIVVLGCALKAPGVLGGAAARRVERAFRAHADGVAERIVVSGGRRWFGVSEAEAFREALCLRGVPSSSVLMELCSFSTSENASYTAELFGRHGFEGAALVTCDWHMPRALACFERAGLDCQPFPASSPELGNLARAKRRLGEHASEALDRFFTFGFRR